MRRSLSGDAARSTFAGDAAPVGRVTLGIDLASRADRTAACVLSWATDEVTVTALHLGLTDAALIDLATGADTVGIDVPLGWPRRFAEAVSSHASSLGWPAEYAHDVHSLEMQYRATDRWLSHTYGHRPLSVSSDRLAIPAMRAAWLLPHLQEPPADLAGGGKVVEVYPAIALRRWGLPYRGYKRRRGADVRRRIIAALAGCSRLSLDACRGPLEESDDLLDSLLASLVARAHQLGLCEPIPDDHLEDARREGWIAVPGPDSLHDLIG